MLDLLLLVYCLIDVPNIAQMLQKCASILALGAIQQYEDRNRHERVDRGPEKLMQPKQMEVA